MTLVEIIAVATAGVAFVGALLKLIPTLVAFVKAAKADKNWFKIVAMAFSAMSKVEKTERQGKDKEDLAVQIVKSLCEEQGVDFGADTEQRLREFIQTSITFANGIKKK